MSWETEGVIADDLSGIRELPARQEAASAAAPVQACACGACRVLLADGDARDYATRCARCQAAGCDPFLGVAHCGQEEASHAG